MTSVITRNSAILATAFAIAIAHHAIADSATNPVTSVENNKSSKAGRTTKEHTQIQFEELSTQLTYLALESVLYDRPDHFFQVADNAERANHFKILNTVTDGSYSKDDLKALLRHSNPKVRTLAAVAIFDREDPSMLPELVQLCRDETPTYDGYPRLSESWLRWTGVGPPQQKKQTVGYIAQEMVAFYMKPSGYYYGLRDFAAYWEARKNRSFCSAWYSIQLLRATQGSSHYTGNWQERVRAIRKQIDALPADERAWMLLSLSAWMVSSSIGEIDKSVLVTERELLDACKHLGRDKLIQLLQSKIPCNDPDLQLRDHGNGIYWQMVHFVLTHANDLLHADDGDILLSCESWHRDYLKHGLGDPYISPEWSIAAARLKPQKASAILHGAMKRFQDGNRSGLCVVMWQLLGSSNIEFIADWFYNESPERGSFPNARGSFIEAMSKEPNGKAMIARLIRDSRLSRLDWQSLERLVRACNKWLDTPVVSEAELAKAWHPFGQGHFHWSQSEAEQKYPQETKQLREHLSEWQKRLKAIEPNLIGKAKNQISR